MSDIRQKLSKVQQALKAPKSQFNSFANYKYRNQEDILEALKPLLEKEGLVLVLGDEVVNVGEANYVKAYAKVADIDGADEDYIEVTAYAREEVSLKGQIAAQITGGASSYARKYALNGLFNIDDSQDPDSQDNTKKKVVTDTSPKDTASTHSTNTTTKSGSAANKLATPKQKKLIADKLAEMNIKSKEDIQFYLADEFGINDTDNMTIDDASSVIESLIG